MNKKDFYAYSTLGVSIAAICGIVFSPSIPITIGCTALGATYGLFSLSKLKK